MSALFNPAAPGSRLRENTAVSHRDFGFDNLRGLLMLLVVFGHTMEVSAPFPGSSLLYQIIYSFHMPVFLFLSGYFSRFSPEKLLHNWVLPYGIFQTLYILFGKYVLCAEISLQYTTPYSHLWYLMVGILCQLLLPLFDARKPAGQILTLTSVFLIAIAVGYESTVSYYASLSRFFVYQPWFVMGLYYRKAIAAKTPWLCNPPKAVTGILIPAAVLCSAAAMCRLRIANEILYCSYPYFEIGYTPLTRITVMLMAFSWLLLFLYVLKPLLGKKLPVLTTIGQNTLPIFLLHQFITKAIPVFLPELLPSPVLTLLITLLICVILGNPFFSTVIRILCLQFPSPD